MVKMNKGFTLIEMLVSMAVFVVIVTIVVDLFFVSFLAGRKALAYGAIFDQTSFLAEYMSRSLRMARKELTCTDQADPATCSCLKINGYGHNYEKTRSGNGIRFINSQGLCQEFFLETSSHRLKELKGGVEQYLSPSNSRVTAFNISLLGEGQMDNLQPRATFFLSLQRLSAKPELQPLLQIQTTVSQRKLDIEL